MAKRSTLTLFTLGFSLVGALALAHSGATGIVKERMDLMSQIGKDTKAMAAMARGQAELDWDLIAKAGTFAASTAKHLPMKFPEDSFKAPSEAKTAIVSDAAGFKAEVEALWLSGLALTTAGQTQDEEAFQLAFSAYATTCSACHKKYRE